MLCMKTYSERLAHAMQVRGMDPAKSQTALARKIGRGIKPQVIQALLDPNKNIRNSIYTPYIAAALQCDSMWLATGDGLPPGGEIAPGEEKFLEKIGVIDTVAMEPQPTDYGWPWSVSRARIAALPPDFFGRLDGYIEGRVEEYERAHKAKQAAKPRAVDGMEPY